ncbi:MAG: hypothetical protein RMK89_06590 [Armatimonadota bacterium]|nr:hypothetical protein [Armatimonadota bacterium]MDW8143115.1 hypothetical protein [Armatimonadota bacterium]
MNRMAKNFIGLSCQDIWLNQSEPVKPVFAVVVLWSLRILLLQLRGFENKLGFD